MDRDEIPTALKVEHFQAGEDTEFRIQSQVGIVNILRDIARHEETVALYYNDDQEFIPTRLLEVDDDEEGFWVAASGTDEQNAQLRTSGKVTFVSMHQHIKIQFPVSGIGLYPYKGGKAFFIDMPAWILRLLRREFVRIPIPPEVSVKCIIPTRPKSSDHPMLMHEVPVVEISGDGLGLLCEENDDTLLPGKTFRDCQIVLPDFGTLKATLRVRTNVPCTTPDGNHRKHAGCQLLFLDNRMGVLLQRYIIHLQESQKEGPLKRKIGGEDDGEQAQENSGG